MRKYIHNLTALVMALFMLIEFSIPAFSSLAQKEETNQFTINIDGIEKYTYDENSSFSLNLATMVDEKNLSSDSNVKFALKTTRDAQTIRLIVRKDFNLYNENQYEKIEDAQKELKRITDELSKQGLKSDFSIAELDGKYFIQNDSNQDLKNYGDQYKVYDLSTIQDFDFDKNGLQKSLPKEQKTERLYVFDFVVDKDADIDQKMIELNKDEDNPIAIYHDGDLFGAVINDKQYATYRTTDIQADLQEVVDYKSKKDINQSKPADSKSEDKTSKTEIITEEKSKEDKS